MDEQEEAKKQNEGLILDNLSILDDAISSFEWLLKRKYKISLAHNEKEIDIELVFLPKTFIHLSGINKLADISFSTNTAHAALYREIRSEESIRRQIAGSSYFNDIVGRLYSIIDLKDNFEDAENNRHFKFVKKIGNNYTLIDYEFFIKSTFDKDTYYYFLRYSNNLANRNECILISTFIENNKDYSIGQESMTLLKKIVVELDTGIESTIFDYNNR